MTCIFDVSPSEIPERLRRAILRLSDDPAFRPSPKSRRKRAHRAARRRRINRRGYA